MRYDKVIPRTLSHPEAYGGVEEPRYPPAEHVEMGAYLIERARISVSDVEALDPFEVLELVPHPLTIVTAGDPNLPGKRGGMAAAWVSRVSWDPPLLAVAMTKARHTYGLIKEFKAFAVHVVSRRFEEVAIEVFGSLSGKSVDKFERAGIVPVRAEKVVAPIIPGMPAVMECRLVAEYEAGDHVIVIGEVVRGYRGSDDPPLIWIGSSTAELLKK